MSFWAEYEGWFLSLMAEREIETRLPRELVDNSVLLCAARPSRGPRPSTHPDLREAGIGLDQIARLAGISPSHVRELVPHTRTGRRPIQRIRPETAQRLLVIAVTDANRASRSHVDATGTRRRLQALIAIGWTQTALANADHHRAVDEPF